MTKRSKTILVSMGMLFVLVMAYGFIDPRWCDAKIIAFVNNALEDLENGALPPLYEELDNDGKARLTEFLNTKELTANTVDVTDVFFSIYEFKLTRNGTTTHTGAIMAPGLTVLRPSSVGDLRLLELLPAR